MSTPKHSGSKALPPAANSRSKERAVVFGLNGQQLTLLGIGAGIVISTSIAALIILFTLLMLPSDRISDGVTVAGIDLSGENPETAAQALQETFASRPITVADEGRQWNLSLGDLGITPDIAFMVAAAEAASANTILQPQFTINLSQTQNALVTVSEQAYIEPTTTTTGRAVEIPVLLDRLRLDVSGEVADGLINLPMIELPMIEAVPASDYDGPTTSHVISSGEELGLIARMYNVSLEDLVAINEIEDPNLIYAGQELIIPAAGVYEPTAEEAPPAPTATGRSILVSVSHQRIYAYENGHLVHSHLVSTGLPATPTVLGDYAVYVKYVATDMSGPDYYLPDVPYTMYFYQGYGIHGTYWHNNFGRPMSHGCVNLPTNEAEWFFNFASVGTPVRVIA